MFRTPIQWPAECRPSSAPRSPTSCSTSSATRSCRVATRPGERLPTQRVLAAELDVNLASVRQAVARLEQLRLVEVRHGDAMRVLDWRSAGGLEALAALGATDVGIIGPLFEARRLLLVEAARLAAERRSDAQSERLGELASAFGEATDDAGALAVRLAVHVRGDRGGGQHRVPADHELGPPAVPPERIRVRARRRRSRRAGAAVRGDGRRDPHARRRRRRARDRGAGARPGAEDGCVERPASAPSRTRRVRRRGSRGRSASRSERRSRSSAVAGAARCSRCSAPAIT